MVVSSSERVVMRRQLSRNQVVGFFEKLEPCLIGIEACASAHHWGIRTDGSQGSSDGAAVRRFAMPRIAGIRMSD
jgi:hypothetical protein